MAGLAIELASQSTPPVPIEIIAGITSATAMAARLGAPLMLDFACISLSDLLVPWETICKRLEAVAAADLVTALYNPKSKKRVTQLNRGSRDIPKASRRKDASGNRHRGGHRRRIDRDIRSGQLSIRRNYHEKHCRDRKPIVQDHRRLLRHATRVHGMILLIGGTTEAAEFAEGLARSGFSILVSTATEIPLAYRRSIQTSAEDADDWIRMRWYVSAESKELR